MTPTTHIPWRGYERGEPAYRRIVLALFAAGFATFVQVFDAQAVLPAVGADLGLPASTTVLLVSATTIGLAISVLPWSTVADRIGRTKAMKISLLAATTLSLVAPLMPTFEAVVATRFLNGLALGAVPGVALAYLAEEMHGRWVSVAAGTYVSGNTIGGIAGRLIAGPLSESAGWRVGLFAVGLLAAVAAVVFVSAAPVSQGFVRLPGGHPVLERVALNLRDPVMLALFAQGFLLMGAFAAVYNYLGFRLTAPPFGIPVTLVSLLFLAYLAGTVTSRISGGLARRFGALLVILVGIAVMAGGALLMLSDALPLIVVGLVVFTVGCFSAHPVASGLTGQWAQVGRAQATALYQLSWLVGTALFGWLLGLVFVAFGWSPTVFAILGLCGLAALSAVLGLGLLRNRRPEIPALPGEARCGGAAG